MRSHDARGQWAGRLIRLNLLWFALLAGDAIAQETGAIHGAVRDNSGGVIPNAELALTDTGRDVMVKAKTNAEGAYTFPALPAGVYNLSATVQGFNRYELKGIVLRVAQQSRIDLVLAVGETQSTVTVEGSNAGQVETVSSEVSGIVTGKQITQILLNGRVFSQLVTLVPGVSNQTNQDEGVVGSSGSVSMSINGGRTNYNNWQIDGGSNMDSGSNATLNIYPNIDAIAEVKVMTSNYGAQYGRNGAATIEAITKSGTKDFHGNAFEFLRNEAFNARNFFTAQRPKYRKNEFGYTLGGPLVIPGVYNKKRDRTFFFWSQDWRRQTVPGRIFTSGVPSNAERTGDFSAVCPGRECPRDPATGLPFPNNRVPVNTNAQVIMDALIPAPNTTIGGLPYYYSAPALPTNWREELIRVDHYLSSRIRGYFRYIHDAWHATNPTPGFGTGGAASFDAAVTDFQGPAQNIVASLTATLSPTLVNEFSYSYSTGKLTMATVKDFSRPSSMTMTGIYDNGFGGRIPAISLVETGSLYGGGFSQNLGWYPWEQNQPEFSFRDQFSKSLGGHNMYFGVQHTRRKKDGQYTALLNGTLTFNNTSPLSTGNAFADLLTGRIASYSQDSAKPYYHGRAQSTELFFQDDWRVSRRLTINAGLRLSLYGPETDPQTYNFDPRYYNPASAPQIDATGSITGWRGALVPNTGNPFEGLVQCGGDKAPDGCVNSRLFNPAPRFGFAWDPRGDGKMAIRGGYGIFFEWTNGNEGAPQLRGVPVVLSATQFNINGYTNIGGGLLQPLTKTALNVNNPWPYVQQWHLDLQRELFYGTVVNISYVGSKGTRLTTQRDLNQLRVLEPNLNPYPTGQAMVSADCQLNTVNGRPVTGQAAINFAVACGFPANPYRPYVGYGSIAYLDRRGNSSYNSMQLALHKRSGRLTYNLAYTWSHSIDDSSGRGDGTFTDSYNTRLARASSNFDQRHVFNIGYVYDLPRLRSQMMNTLVGGWQIAGLTSINTGNPFTITNGSFGPGAGNGVGTNSFVRLVGDPNSAPPVKEVAGIVGPLLFNPSAFAQPTGLTYGDSGRNNLRFPRRTNIDVGLFKLFRVNEAYAFELRAEGFNVFNHTQWSSISASATCFAGPNFSAGDSSCLARTFLHPTAARNPRILQFGLKFAF